MPAPRPRPAPIVLQSSLARRLDDAATKDLRHLLAHTPLAAIHLLAGSSQARRSISFLEILAVVAGPHISAHPDAELLIKTFYRSELEDYLVLGEGGVLTEEQNRVCRILDKFTGPLQLDWDKIERNVNWAKISRLPNFSKRRTPL